MHKDRNKLSGLVKNGWYVVCLLSVLVIMNRQAFGQTETSFEFPLESSGSLQFYADVCQFAASDSHTRMEISYGVPLSQFVKGTEVPDSVHLVIELSILDSLGNTLTSSKDEKAISAGQLTGRAGVDFIDLKPFLVQLDRVKMALSIRDTQSGRSGDISGDFTVRNLENGFSVSDPFFASSIRKAEEKNNFVKHGLLLVPAPSREFRIAGNDAQNLYVYYEINHMYYDEDDPSYYQTDCRVKDVVGNTVYEENKAAVLKKSANTSRVEIIPLQKLTSGIYRLSLSITDLKHETTRTVGRYFRVESARPAETTVLPMEKNDIEKYYNQIKYIATENEKKVFKRLDAKGKQEFILRFWQKRDPTPDTPTNEFMIEHFKKLAYIEKNFTDGIDSDRARILIEYGPPMDIERYPSMEGIARPVEIWTYGINGNTRFVFVDRTRDGVYVLVHSNHPDEYHNPDWREDLQ